MKRIVGPIVLLLAAALWARVPMLVPQSAFGGTGTVHTVTGEVVAINITETPHVIVVRTRIGKSDDLIVGATVGGEVPIMRGKKSIELASLKVGESVAITYVKNPEGLVAKRILAR